MREIKFRAWDHENEIMRYFPFSSISKDYYDEPDTEFKLVFGDEFHDDYTAVWEDAEKMETALMQYTGLKDKNGKEIYEKDIVIDIESPHDKGIVKWYPKGHWGIDFNYLSNTYLPKYTTEFEIEIIGNIYENPELLK